MLLQPYKDPNYHPKTLLLGIFTPNNPIADFQAYFDEFVSLVDTLGTPYDATMFIKLRTIEKGTFLSKGKLEEVMAFCKENDIEQVIISEVLTPMQERNLSDLFHTTVLDRTGLIIEIFRNAAVTSEGRVQVEMAELKFLKTRLAGRGEDLAQQAGKIGEKGPGETVKEQLRRMYAEKLRQATKRLETLERARETQRARRIESRVPLACIIGYTNAGKSSLLNRLTKSDVLVEDKLFATLNATTRTFYTGPNKHILLSDTVGFISQLPPQLIEAFKSTLEELQYAHLLLLVVDITNPMWRDHIAVVQQILDELEIDKPLLYVFNKIDQVVLDEHLKLDLHPYQPYVCTSTLSKEGVAELRSYLEQYQWDTIRTS